MNSKDRVLAALARQPIDLVPVYHLGFSSDVASALLGREAFVGGGIQRWREAVSYWNGQDAHQEFLERSYRDAVAIARVCDHDVLRPEYWRYDRKPTRRVDENTFLYEYGPEGEWRVLVYDPASEQCDVAYCKPPPPATFESVERELAAAEAALTDYRPTERGFSAEIRAQRELGSEYEIRVGAVGVGLPYDSIWLEALLLRPDLVTRHLDLQLERARRNVAFLAPLGFRLFWGGGDFSSNDGPMYSPRLFRELVIPRLRAVTEVCHRNGARHLFASDGDLWPVADVLFGERTVDGYYEIDRRAGMDLRRLRDRYPELSLFGNVSSHTVHLGTRQEIVEEALSAIEVARSGGVVVGTSNYWVPHTPIDNVLTLLQAIRENR